MLATAWAETDAQGTNYKKKWYDPNMKNKDHPNFERMYIAFEDVPARVPSILNEVTDSHVSNQFTCLRPGTRQKRELRMIN